MNKSYIIVEELPELGAIVCLGIAAGIAIYIAA